jgi:hypothetical protein
MHRGCTYHLLCIAVIGWIFYNILNERLSAKGDMTYRMQGKSNFFSIESEIDDVRKESGNDTLTIIEKSN